MLTKEHILAYLSEIKPELEAVGITDIGLFGSYAKGTADYVSDIDITLKSTAKFRSLYCGFDAILYLEELHNNLEKKFKRPVDICNTASMTEERKKEILEGVIYV